MEFRKGKIQDARSIASLLVKSWRENYHGFLPNTYLDNLSIEKQTMRHESFLKSGIRYLIAENNSGIIAFCSFGKNRNSSFEASMELYTIYVDNAYQGQGIGKQLLSQILYSMCETESILVSVFKNNPYKDFYVLHGFELVGEELIDLGEFKKEALIFRYNLS